MPTIGKRISPPEGVETKVGDIVKYELLFDDGSVGTMTTRVEEFDILVGQGPTKFEIDHKALNRFSYGKRTTKTRN